MRRLFSKRPRLVHDQCSHFWKCNIKSEPSAKRKGERSERKGKEGTEDGARKRGTGGKQQEAAAAANKKSLRPSSLARVLRVSRACFRLPVLEMQGRRASSVGDPRRARRRTWRATGGGGGDARRIDKSCEERATLNELPPLLFWCAFSTWCPPPPSHPTSFSFWFRFVFCFYKHGFARKKQPALALQKQGLLMRHQKTFLF